MRFFIQCNGKKMWNKCNNQINENKEFGVNLNISKRKALNEFGHMLPIFEV